MDSPRASCSLKMGGSNTEASEPQGLYGKVGKRVENWSHTDGRDPRDESTPPLSKVDIQASGAVNEASTVD